MKRIFLSSIIQTILSVLEFHQISRLSESRTITAGREFRPAPKNLFVMYMHIIALCEFIGKDNTCEHQEDVHHCVCGRACLDAL